MQKLQSHFDTPELLYQPLEGVEIHFIPIPSTLVFVLWRFENLRCGFPPLVFHDRSETLEADFAVADVGVAIDARAEGFFGIVEMPDLNAVEADGLFDLFEQVVVLFRAKVVAGGE